VQELASFVSGFSDMRKVGNYQGIVSASDAVLNDPSKTDAQKAMAVIVANGARFHLSGNIADKLADVDALKKIATDDTLDPGIRSNAINVMAGNMANSGENPVVFNEVFKDLPFSSFVVPNDSEASVRHLFEWSYSILPNADAAVNIADLFAEPAYVGGLDAATITSNASSAASYIAAADGLIPQEIKRDPGYTQSSRYIDYLWWRTRTVGMLSQLIGAPYSGQYKFSYDQLISTFQQSSNVIAKSDVYYARFYYADVLARSGDIADAKIQLDALAAELKPIVRSSTESYVLSMRNGHAYTPGEYFERWADEAGRISPDFKAQLSAILATASSTSQTSATSTSAQ
jgi:hypothetical protein